MTVDMERQGAVLTVRLNRPEKKNALTGEMYDAMTDALQLLDGDGALRALVFLGGPDVFTSGNDLHDFLAVPLEVESSPAVRFIHTLSVAAKPLIAAVRGDAVGVGTTMLLHCDLVYAASGARFRLPFVSLGLVPEAGSSLLLPQLAGYQKSFELLLLGEFFDADAALQIGMVNDVAADDAVEAVALGRAAVLSALPPEAVRQSKALLKSSSLKLQDRLGEEFSFFAERLGSAEAKEAMTAFMEKRRPDFSKFC